MKTMRERKNLDLKNLGHAVPEIDELLMMCQRLSATELICARAHIQRFGIHELANGNSNTQL